MRNHSRVPSASPLQKSTFSRNGPRRIASQICQMKSLGARERGRLKPAPDALTTTKGRWQQRPLRRDCLAGLSLSRMDGWGWDLSKAHHLSSGLTLKLRTRYCRRSVPRETDPEISGLCTRNSPGSTVETRTCRGGDGGGGAGPAAEGGSSGVVTAEARLLPGRLCPRTPSRAAPLRSRGRAFLHTLTPRGLAMGAVIPGRRWLSPQRAGSGRGSGGALGGGGLRSWGPWGRPRPPPDITEHSWAGHGGHHTHP